jgi:excisionase family DNA binding protein
MRRAITPKVDRRAYSVDETREILRCSRQKVYDLIAESRLQAFKIGRLTRITRESIDALMAGGVAAS